MNPADLPHIPLFGIGLVVAIAIVLAWRAIRSGR